MSQATSYFSIAVAVIILLVDLWAIVSVFRSDKTVGVKAAWAIGLILFGGRTDRVGSCRATRYQGGS